MGLVAAYQAVLDGHQVDVVEAAPEAGGMAGHFDFSGISIERFYHFVSRCDHPTFALMAELGIAQKMVWVPTSMGLFLNGRLNTWGDPVSLLKLPGISLLSKLRYGVLAMLSVRRNSWDALENESAKNWILRWGGREVYERFWH